MLRRIGFVFAVFLWALVGVAGCGNEAPSPLAPVDTVPPALVVGLTASVSATATPSITLHWDPGSEPDLVGYRVYRNVTRDPTGSTKRGATRIALAVIHQTTSHLFIDTSVLLGGSYIYAVTAIDVSGNESPSTSTGTIAVVPHTHLPEERIKS